MSIKIYDKGAWGNAVGVNKATLVLIDCVKYLLKENEDFYRYFKDADIYVTSGTRPEGHHANGQAVDITCSKWVYLPFLYAYLQSVFPKYCIFISSYNHHIHLTCRYLFRMWGKRKNIFLYLQIDANIKSNNQFVELGQFRFPKNL